MNIAIVIYSNDPETVWNAVRLGVHAIKKGQTVRVFLLGKGVEIETLDTRQFNIPEQLRAFTENGGELLACGTCLKQRQQEGSAVCPISTMDDLYRLIIESDRVLTF